MFDLFLTCRHCTSSVSKVKRSNFYVVSLSALQTMKPWLSQDLVLREANRETPQMNLLAAPKCGSTQTLPSCYFNWRKAFMSSVRLRYRPSFAAQQIDSVSFYCQFSKCAFSSLRSSLIISFALARGMQLICSQMGPDREILKAFRLDVKKETLSLQSLLSPSICIKRLRVTLNRNDTLKKTKCCLTF